MKKQILLIFIILVGLTACEKVKSSEDVKIEAEAFKQKLIHVKGLGKTFLDLFGVSEQKQLKSLTIGESIPVITFDNQKLGEDNFQDRFEDQSIAYYIIPYMINSQVVCWAYFSSTTGSIPFAMTPVKCSVLKKEHIYASIGGSSVPVGLKLHIFGDYTDMTEFDIGIYKYKDEFYGISLRDSFFSEKEKAYQLKNGKSYTLQTIQQILKKNLVENKEND